MVKAPPEWNAKMIRMTGILAEIPTGTRTASPPANLTVTPTEPLTEIPTALPDLMQMPPVTPAEMLSAASTL